MKEKEKQGNEGRYFFIMNLLSFVIGAQFTILFKINMIGAIISVAIWALLIFWNYNIINKRNRRLKNESK